MASDTSVKSDPLDSSDSTDPSSPSFPVKQSVKGPVKKAKDKDPDEDIYKY